MPEPSTPLPSAKASGGDERSVLLGYLDYHRSVLARKAEGITDEQARSAVCPPSDLTLLGLICHATDVERLWFRQIHVGEDIPFLYGGPVGSLDPPPDTTLDGALAAYWDEIGVANRILAAGSLDDLDSRNPNPDNTLRRMVVHLIEEYARHCGHADLLRQAIDGNTGD